MITIRGTVRGCNECSVDVQLVVADDMGAGSESDRFWFGLGEDGNDNTVVARAFGALIGIDGGVIIRIDKAADATGLARRGRVLAMPSGNDPPPAYPIFGVTLPGRTLSHVTQTTVTLSFHPDDGDDAERIVEAVRTAATGRTVSFEVR